jgi:ABC-type lipoprotein release transport system permease subunit/predicted secreted hydrolase
MPELVGAAVADPVAGHPEFDRVLHVEGFDLLAPLPRAFEFRSELPGAFAPIGSGPDPSRLIDGRGVIVSARFARQRGARVGDVLPVRVGASRVALRIAALFPPATAALDANVAVVDIATAQELFGEAGSFDRIACTAQAADVDRARASVLKLLPPGARIVTTNDGRLAVERAFAAFDNNLAALGAMALAVAGVLVYDAISMSVARRRSDIATIRALGATGGAIARAFVGEGVLLGAIGALLGVAGGSLLAVKLGAVPLADDLYAEDRAAPLVAFGLGIAIATLAAVLPARSAAALRPAEAWSRRPFRAMSGRGAKRVASHRAFAFAPPAIRFGVALLEAAPARLAASVASLACAVALAVAVLVFASSLHASLGAWSAAAYPGDITIRPLEGAAAVRTARFSPSFVARLTAVPGVRRVAGSRGFAFPLAHATSARAPGDTTFDTLAIDARPAADLARLRVRLERALAPRVVDIETTRDLRATLLAHFDAAADTTVALAGAAIVAGAAGIATTLFALVLEFRDEIRLLRIAGLTRRGVRTMLCAQAASIGLLGGLAGIALGAALAGALVVSDRTDFGWSLTFAFPTAALAATFLASVALATIAGILPARHAAKLSMARAAVAVFALAGVLGSTGLAARAMPAPTLATRAPALASDARAKREVWRALGHLAAPDGARYDVAATFFRYSLGAPKPGSAWAAAAFEASDVAIVDENGRTIVTGTRVEREGIGFAHASTARLDVRVDDWTLRERSNGARFVRSPRFDLHLAQGNVRVALTLAAQQPAVALGPDGAAALPRLAARGTLAYGGRRIAVRGNFWIDRESGNDAGDTRGGRRQRFTIQFDDGRDLIAWIARDDGGHVTATSGVFVDRSGRVRYLNANEMDVENPLGTTWRNARGIPYPSLWDLSVPSLGFDLALVPDVQAQEIDPALRGARFYLGALDVERAGPGRRDTGRGYAELTGYASSP